ncbi:hypothetical protein M9458_031879, partial [Cirrhinus mrigala]
QCGNEYVTCLPECGSENFCLRCRAGSYLHKGKCMESCPDGLVPIDTKKECVPGEYDKLVFSMLFMRPTTSVKRATLKL